jgi:hypothetical protein
MARDGRRRNKSVINTDNFYAKLFPLVIIGLAIYQQVVNGEIDRLTFGALVLFGLSAAGYKVDAFFDTYMRAKYGAQQQNPPPVMPAREPAELENDNKDDNGDTA